MYSISAQYQAQIEVKQSKFIAHLVPMADFEGLQEKLRETHPKSRHVVYALRYLNTQDQIVENSSDDGEPKGSSGVPALNVLRGEDLINVAVLIVRYFGGTKLGIGGLVRAYTEATKSVVAVADLERYEKQQPLSFTSAYAAVQHIEYLLAQAGIVEIEKVFEATVSWRILAAQEALDTFVASAGRMIVCAA